MPVPNSSTPAGLSGAKAPVGAMHVILAIAGWFWGGICIISGLANISNHPGYAILLVALGLLVLPPVWRMAVAAIGRPLTLRYTIIPGMLAVIPISAMVSQATAEREAEDARLAAAAAEVRRQDSAFLSAHPNVDPYAYSGWKAKAKDSSSNSRLGLGSFLSIQDSVRKQRVADSVLAEKTRRQDSIRNARAAYQAKIDAERAAKRAAAAERERYEPEMYNGHEVHTGPRGGRYYINSNGNKVYL